MKIVDHYRMDHWFYVACEGGPTLWVFCVSLN